MKKSPAKKRMPVDQMTTEKLAKRIFPKEVIKHLKEIANPKPKKDKSP